MKHVSTRYKYSESPELNHYLTATTTRCLHILLKTSLRHFVCCMDRRVYIFYKKPIGRSEQPLRSALGLHMSPLHCRVQMNLNQIRRHVYCFWTHMPFRTFFSVLCDLLNSDLNELTFPLIVFMFRFAHSFYARIYNSSSHHFVTSFTFYVFELLFWLHSILGQSPRPGMCHLRYKALQLHRMGADTPDLHRKVVSHEKQVRAVAQRPS